MKSGVNMFDFIYKDDIRYEEAMTESDTNTFGLKQAVVIKGLRLKGHYQFTTSGNGDSVTSSIVYRTKIKIKKNSKLNGHVVMESVRVDSILDDAGYINYCK